MSDVNRLLDPTQTPFEAGQDLTLRPQYFDDMIGQTELLANIRVFVQAAKTFFYRWMARRVRRS